MTTPTDQGPARDLLSGLRERVQVSPPPIENVVRRGRTRRRNRRSLAWGAVVTVAALTTAGAFAVRAPDDAVITPTKSVIGLPWWADGTLHLPGRDVSIAGVQQLARVPGGVVVSTEDRAVTYIRSDGTTARIGLQKWGSADGGGGRLHADTSSGNVAWIDDAPGGGQDLVVYDTATGSTVARHQIVTDWPDPATLLAFDDGVVYYDTRDHGNRGWHVDSGGVDRITSGASYIEDVQNGIWLTQSGSGQSGLDLTAGGAVRRTTVVGGHPSQLTRDAQWVVVERPSDASGELTSAFKILLSNATDRNEVPTGLKPGLLVVAVSSTDDGSIVYAVADSANGPFDLVGCRPPDGECITYVKEAAIRLPVVLPDDITRPLS